MRKLLVMMCAIAVLGLGVAGVVSAQLISGFPTTDAKEAATAQAAFDKGDKGNPDPAWRLRFRRAPQQRRRHALCRW